MGARASLDFGDTSPENSIMHSAIAAAKPDFSGWATKANIECADGRTILPDAFAHQDQMKVPLVWMHTHNDPENVLGHAILESREGGVYAHGYFNKTAKAATARELIEHDDINALSIFANKLRMQGQKVAHGLIRELSLVMAGANPGALIDNIQLQHADGETVTISDEAIIYTGESLKHSEDEPDETIDEPANTPDESVKIQHAVDSMTDEQKEALHYLVGAAIESKAPPAAPGAKPDLAHSGLAPEDKENGRVMSRNAFEEQNGTRKSVPENERVYVSHDDLQGIKADAMSMGSLKKAVETYAIKHNIDNIEVLFPEAKTLNALPEIDSRRMEWVKRVMGGTRKTPFSRIKQIVADITHEEARARGYIKATFKKEEWFGLTTRKTTPTTVYKKQKLDRDDIIDITDFDVVAFLKAEMRVMLEEEIARAVLLGDGRAADDPDKIKDPVGANEGEGIRSIANDHDLYAHVVNVPIDDANFNPQTVIDEVTLASGAYKGSGSPTFFTTRPLVTKMLLAKDTLGRRLYRTRSDLAAELDVGDIVDVEVMEQYPDILGIIVNLTDYALGADRGGDVATFDDFDIDYNQFKYLIETRLSGALIRIRAALVIKKIAHTLTKRVPAAPTFNAATGEITVPNPTGVSYRRADTNAVVTNSVIALDEFEALTIYAVPTAGNYFANDATTEWMFRNGRQYSGRDADQSDTPGSV